MLAILTTHPIQYQVPLWQALAKDGRVPFEIWYLTSHATKRSHDVEFGKEFSWDLDMLAGYPHRFLEVAPGATPNSFWKCRLKEKLSDRLRESGARALWINGWQVAAYWQAAREAKAAGVEVWLRGESNDLAPTPWWKRSMKRALLGQLFKRVDRFLYIGSANKRLYQKFGVPDEKLFPTPYAVDNERFRRQASALRAKRQEVSGSQGANFTAGGTETLSVSREAGDPVLVKTGRSAIRSQWNIPEDAFVVLFCGKFIPKKCPADLIAAVSSLVTRHPSLKVHLLFVGSGELGADLRSKCDIAFDAEQSALTAAPLPLSSKTPRASFAGFLNQTEISRAYVAADVLVLPSDYSETWGLVVNEAMASGLPCIVSDRCGCAEDLGKLSPNLTYEYGNTHSLASALINTRDNLLNLKDVVTALKGWGFQTTVETAVRIYFAAVE